VEAQSKRLIAGGDTGKTELVFTQKPASDPHSTGSDDYVMTINANQEKKKKNKKRKNAHSTKAAESLFGTKTAKRGI
jgi:hypothetical protein